MIRVIELFAGVGAQRQALKNIGIEHVVVAISEIDQHAYRSYVAIHGPTLNLGDIRKIEYLPAADLWTYSYPCQDLSNMGCRRGMSEGDDTRSALLWEIKRLLLIAKERGELPDVLQSENVPAVQNKENRRDLNKWIAFLSSLGYRSSEMILDSADYGIPQDRERHFMVSCLDGRVISEPPKIKSHIVLADLLEPTEDVSDDYFLTQHQIDKFVMKSKMEEDAGNGFRFSTIDPEIERERERERESPNAYDHNESRWSDDGQLCSCPDREGRRHRQPCGSGQIQSGVLYIRPVTFTDDERLREDPHSQRYETGISGGLSRRRHRRSQSQQRRYSWSSASTKHSDHTHAGGGIAVIVNLPEERKELGYIEYEGEWYSVRILTERECWRLMGFTDDAFDKVVAVGTSKTQLYKQAGNSIVVPVLEALYNVIYNTKVAKQPLITDWYTAPEESSPEVVP